MHRHDQRGADLIRATASPHQRDLGAESATDLVGTPPDRSRKHENTKARRNLGRERYLVLAVTGQRQTPFLSVLSIRYPNFFRPLGHRARMSWRPGQTGGVSAGVVWPTTCKTKGCRGRGTKSKRFDESKLLRAAAHIFLLKTSYPFADRCFDFPVSFHHDLDNHPSPVRQPPPWACGIACSPEMSSSLETANNYSKIENIFLAIYTRKRTMKVA